MASISLERHFLIRTDHYSLKFLLDQRLSTVPQHQWISKLFGFDFAVEYRPGRLNTMADALPRRDAFSWDEEAKAAFQELKSAFTTGPVLQMPNFDELFMVDCDASGVGFGAVLHQEAGPIAFFSRPSLRATSNWRPTSGSSSVWCRQFVIGTHISGGATFPFALIITS